MSSRNSLVTFRNAGAPPVATSRPRSLSAVTAICDVAACGFFGVAPR